MQLARSNWGVLPLLLLVGGFFGAMLYSTPLTCTNLRGKVIESHYFVTINNRRDPGMRTALSAQLPDGKIINAEGIPIKGLPAAGDEVNLQRCVNNFGGVTYYF